LVPSVPLFPHTTLFRSDLATALLDAAALAPGQRVLDLASGPGLLARDAALRVAPGGTVLATDIAEGMLAEGARRCGEHADAPCLDRKSTRLNSSHVKIS